MELMYSIFVATAMAMCMAATRASADVTFEPNDPFVVPKTVISSSMRFVHAVGLEGTGHHYFAEVQGHLFKTNKRVVRITHGGGVKAKSYVIDASMGGNAERYSTELSGAREDMRKLARRGAALQYPGTVVSMHGHNSYPMGHGPNKALKYVDLRMLAEVAEAEGVDLRVLYLRRPVKDLLIANTIHRGFQRYLDGYDHGTKATENNYMQYMQILFTDIAVMHSFLAELGPGFVVCHDFDRLGNVEQSAAIADFLAPNGDIAELLKNSLVAVAGAGRPPSNESLLYEASTVVASRLQRKFDAFESQICSGRSLE